MAKIQALLIYDVNRFVGFAAESGPMKGRRLHFPRKEQSMSKIFLSALLISASFAIPAFAQEVTRDVHIDYSDLNLDNPSGLRTLDRRISRAVNIVCPEDGRVDLASAMKINKCRKLKTAEVASIRKAALDRFAAPATQYASSH
jgi:UrcA family protein